MPAAECSMLLVLCRGCVSLMLVLILFSCNCDCNYDESVEAKANSLSSSQEGGNLLDVNLLPSAGLRIDGDGDVVVVDDGQQQTRSEIASGSISPSFGIAMTTIPPRFSHIHEALSSWLRQEAIVPSKIVIFVPSYYRRFKMKNRTGSTDANDNDNVKSDGKGINARNRDDKNSTSSSYESFKFKLERVLLSKNDVMISSALRSGVISIETILNDWGPISRIVGLLQFVNERFHHHSTTTTRDFLSGNLFEKGVAAEGPDYWIVCDDDVRYVSDLILRYNFVLAMRDALCISSGRSDCGHSTELSRSSAADIKVDFSPVSNSNPNNPFSNVDGGFSRLVLSQFVADYRLVVSLPDMNDSGSNNNNNINSNRDDSGDEPLLVSRRIAHLQAVDSYLLPSEMLRSQLTSTLPFSAALFKILVREVHQTCPLSFYQDDYVVSFILSISGVSVTSIWNNNKANDHIEGVSKSHHQMHMDPMVFHRELDTKLCLVKNANYFFQLALSARQRLIATD